MSAATSKIRNAPTETLNHLLGLGGLASDTSDWQALRGRVEF